MLYACASYRGFKRDVPSSRNPSHYYQIRPDESGNLTCTCPGFWSHHHCKHVDAVRPAYCGWSMFASPDFPVGGKCPRCGMDVIILREIPKGEGEL